MNLPPSDWKEFFDRVEQNIPSRPVPPAKALRTHPSLIPDYSRGGAPRGQTPFTDPIPYDGPVQKKPFDYHYVQPRTLERTIGLPQKREKQAWKTAHREEWPGCEIDLDVVEQQRRHTGARGFFSDFVHQARMKGVDLSSNNHIYGKLRGVGGGDSVDEP